MYWCEIWRLSILVAEVTAPPCFMSPTFRYFSNNHVSRYTLVVILVLFVCVLFPVGSTRTPTHPYLSRVILCNLGFHFKMILVSLQGDPGVTPLQAKWQDYLPLC